MIRKNTASNPLVSVLMTAYNREKYIGEAIESVINSTYQDLELIIVDDCSSDSTVEIARSYAQTDERIRVYENEQNLGDYPNRNRAAGYAKGKYLKYVDADDMVYPNGLEIIVRNMEQFPQAKWGIMSQRQFDHKSYPLLIKAKEIYRIHYIKKKPILNKAPLSVVITKELFEQEGGFKAVRHYGDAELWHRLALEYDVVLMQDGIVWWRGNHDQESGKKFFKVDIFFDSIKMIQKNIMSKTCALSIEEKKSVQKNLRKRVIKYQMQLIKKGKGRMLLNYYLQK